jgi:aminopeptidase YwaD
MPINFTAMTDKVFTYTEKLINKYGPRLAGSKSCQDTAEDMYLNMKEFADDVRIEEFGVHTGAFLGWIRILVTLYAAGTALLWFSMPWVAAGVLLVGILIMVFQFFLYKHTIDFLYPKKTGKNLIASVEPRGEVKQQVIISGHHDSARVFNFNIHQPKLYALRVVGGVGILFTLFLFSAVVAIAGLSQTFITFVAIFGSVGALIVLQLWFFASKKATPGAGDNLVASVMALESLRQIAKDKKEGNGLKHTRVIAVSFDAEEEGLRGAYAFAKKNKDELNSVPSYLYNIDCPYYLDDLFFLTTDINGSVKLSDDLAEDCRVISERLGYKAVTKPIEFLTGGTDAAELAKVGVEATTMLAMPWGNSARASVYHTPDDTIDHVEKEVVQAGLEIFFALLKHKDDPQK